MAERSRAETIFYKAIEIDSPKERNAYLDEACIGEPALRLEMNRLVDIHFCTSAFLQQPTLQPPSLVHEAYTQLVNGDNTQHLRSKGHFYTALAEAMRRILLDAARRGQKRMHDSHRQTINSPSRIASGAEPEIDLLALDEAITKLELEHADLAWLVKLRFFAGLTLEETAEILEIPRDTAQCKCSYARAWLFGELYREPLRLAHKEHS